MMRWITFLFLFVAFKAVANDSARLYNPRADVAKDVAQLLVKAKDQKKHVLLQIGGNWCVSCYRFNALVQTDSTLKKLVNNNYLVYHLNYSPENRNLAYLKKLGYPQRFGFPVLVVLDAAGTRLHTQDAALLQKGNGYDREKIKGFLKSWSPAALDALLYKD